MTKKTEKFLCDVSYPDTVTKNPCREIPMPQLLDSNQIIMLQLQGAVVYNYTEQLNLDPEIIVENTND